MRWVGEGLGMLAYIYRDVAPQGSLFEPRRPT